MMESFLLFLLFADGILPPFKTTNILFATERTKKYVLLPCLS